MPRREEIIETLCRELEPESWARALWLEGADASGWLDEYSDLDFWLDFEDAKEEKAIAAVERALERLAPLDFRHTIRHGHPKIRQRFYHLEGTSEYWMIDFCWQLHSRAKEETCYIEGNLLETAKVLFDKDGIVRFRKDTSSEYAPKNNELLQRAAYNLTQGARTRKYLLRGELLEAKEHYDEYVLKTLVTLVRLRYTPRNAEYGMVHISRQVPEEIRKRLEFFADAGTLEKIAQKLPEAIAYGQALERTLEAEKYATP